MDRVYRKRMSLVGFEQCQIQYLDTDLWIGLPGTNNNIEEISGYAEVVIKEIRNQLDVYIEKNKEFKTSHVPLNIISQNNEIVNKMAVVATRAGVGPMASVAGAIAETVGRNIMQKFSFKEIVVENGGDIFMQVEREVNIAVYAGGSPLSDIVGVTIPEGSGSFGICTSSATIGHSFSYGKADAVMVIASDCALADAYATLLCNKVQSENDISSVIEKVNQIEDIISCVIIMNDKMGITGRFELKLFRK